MAPRAVQEGVPGELVGKKIGAPNFLIENSSYGDGQPGCYGNAFFLRGVQTAPGSDSVRTQVSSSQRALGGRVPHIPVFPGMPGFSTPQETPQPDSGHATPLLCRTQGES